MNFASWSFNKKITRIITGTILGLIALFCLFQGGIALLILLSIAVFIGSKEYVDILKNKGFFPSLKIILAADVIFATLAYFGRVDLVAFAFTICAISAFLWVLFKGRQPYIANVSTTVLGFLYGGWFPLHLLFLRNLNAENQLGLLKLNMQNDGLGYVFLLFVVIVLTDTGCYFVGMKFGKTKLAPIVSPKKTIESALGGAIFAILGALIVGHFINIPWYHSLFAGILITIFAQLGDLSESLIKRDAGVKDSGNILPGHGGFLDRTDSFIFTIPILFYYMKYFVASNELTTDFLNFMHISFNTIKGFFHVIGF